MIIGKRFYFDSSHHLENHKGKCKNLHGHTYTLDIEVQGDIETHTRMVVDLHLLSTYVEEVTNNLDHHNLNDLMDEPTCEKLVNWLSNYFNKNLPSHIKLYSLKLQEGRGGWAKWTSQE